MRKIFNIQQMLFSLAVVTVILSSCGGLGKKPDDMINAEKLKAISEKFQRAMGADKRVRSIMITSKDHITNEFGSVLASEVTPNKEISYLFMNDKLEASTEKEISDSAGIPTMAVKDFDFAKIITHYQEAIKLIPAEFEDFTLHLYSVEPNAAKSVDTYFVVEGTKKGEKTEQKGRMITTNYYEFKFNADAAGKLKMQEE